LHAKCRHLTQNAWQKASTDGTLQQYPYLQVGNQLCYQHYLAIVEAKRNKRKEIPTDECSGNTL
jgi:hypothetical protein